MDCSLKTNIQATMLIKKPYSSKSNPLGLKGENMGVFFKQELTNKVIQRAIETNHILIIAK